MNRNKLIEISQTQSSSDTQNYAFIPDHIVLLNLQSLINEQYIYSRSDTYMYVLCRSKTVFCININRFTNIDKACGFIINQLNLEVFFLKVLTAITNIVIALFNRNYVQLGSRV